MFLFAEQISTPWMIAAGGSLLVIWLILRRSLKQKMEPLENVFVKKEGIPARVSGLGMMDVPDELARWEVSMHETARDLKAELDTKMVALQALTKRAQFEADRLEAAIVRAERLGMSTTRDSLAELEGISDGRGLSNVAAALAGSTPTTAAFPPQLCDRIYSQADLGRTPANIAASVGIPLGDVELMLSLRDG